MVAIDQFGHVYPSVHLQEMLKFAQKPAPLAIPTQYNGAGLSNSVTNVMNGDATQKISPEQFGLTNNPSLQFSTPGGGFVQVFGPLKTPGNDKFFHDPNPVVIQKNLNQLHTYKKLIWLTIIHQLHQLPVQSLLKRFVLLNHPLHHHFMFAYNHHHHQNKHL
jgi:hypothetical protein